MTTTPIQPRPRVVPCALVALVVGAGLLLRHRGLGVPAFIAKYGGDALWAWLVFLLFRLLLPRWPTARVAAAALVFSWSIEFSQIYHAPLIDSWRATLLGGLILGSTFNVPDLLAYLVGILLGASIERSLRSKSGAATETAARTFDTPKQP